MKFMILLAFAFVFAACAAKQNHPDETQATTAPSTPVVDKGLSQASTKVDADIVRKEVCELGSDKRVLEVRKKADGCELSYFKNGKSRVVASGRHSLKHCEDSIEKITKKLLAQNYKCQQD